MGGLGFVQLGFLAAGAAVALPVLIHLLFRQKSRTVFIGSARFLQQVVREHRRRRRVRQWLLLALRSLAVLLLALLFARPYFNQAHRRGLEQEHVLLVDRSASMHAREAGGETAWQRAVQAARQELAALDENAVVHVGLCDAAGVEEVSPGEFPGSAQAGHLATDLNLALSWAADVLALSQRSQRRIVLLTDLQRRGLERTPAPQLAPGTQLEIRDLGRPVPHNLAIVSLEAVRTEIRPQEPVSLRAAVRNFGPLPTRGVPVALELTGPRGPLRIERTIDVAGDEATVLDIELDSLLEGESDGVYRGSLALRHEDDLDWDNRRYVAFEARRPDRLLLVDGQEGRSVFGNETYYLETALQLRPKSVAAGRRSFEVERIVWEQGEGFPNLAGFRAILLANVRRLSEVDVRRLREYVDGGGSLVVFAGDQASAPLAMLARAGLLPGEAIGREAAGPFRVNDWDREHPALAPFNDPQYGDLRRLELRRLLPLESPTADARVLLQAGDHAVALERPLGRGRVLYFAATADRDWTDWPRTRLYVPLVRQLMAYATGQLAERMAVASETISRRNQLPGIRDEEGQVRVSNVDPAESDPEKSEIEAVLAAAGIEPTPSGLEGPQAAALAQLPDALRPDEIWTVLVWLLLAVLAIELLVASRVHA